MHHHDHNHDHNHTHEHEHEHSHTHAHEHEHTPGTAHSHSTEVTQPHDHEHSHENLMSSKAEAAAFLQYTLNHNAHHEEELTGLVHSLQHLQLEDEAREVSVCIEDIERTNARLKSVLDALNK